MTTAKPDRTLLITFIVAAILAVACGFLLTWAIWGVCPDRVSTGLTNVATIGGIVSGLSLSGTAVLSLSGRYTARVVGRYGSQIRLVLFGGFTLLVVASLLCAVSVLWADEDWVKVVLGFTVPVMVITLISTAMLINSSFAWKEKGEVERRTPDPYKRLPGQ